MHQYPCARVELDQEEKVTENNRNTNQRWDYLYLHFCLPQRVFVTGDYNQRKGIEPFLHSNTAVCSESITGGIVRLRGMLIRYGEHASSLRYGLHLTRAD
jgi:hypothetical protein